jgi:hypothetical protein
MTTTTKTRKTKTSRKSNDEDKRKPRRKSTAKDAKPKAKASRKARPRAQALVPAPIVEDRDRQDTRSRPADLAGDLPSVTVKDEAEALFYFQRIDDRLAEAWKRDVVMHEGPITIRRCFASRFESTHYAYVDQRLFWYLKHDPTDPLGARWDGYLKSAHDVPQGAIAVTVGKDLIAKKCPPELIEHAP